MQDWILLRAAKEELSRALLDPGGFLANADIIYSLECRVKGKMCWLRGCNFMKGGGLESGLE